jgi:hypothetical protein
VIDSVDDLEFVDLFLYFCALTWDCLTFKSDCLSFGFLSFLLHPLDFSALECLDILDGRILVGHDNGRIQVVNTDGTDKKLANVSHFDGEAWGLEVLQGKGTFLTCGDDNNIY